MSAILIAEIVLVAVVCLKHDDLKGTLKKGFEHTLTKYEANQDAWNFVQKEASILLTTQLFANFQPQKIG